MGSDRRHAILSGRRQRNAECIEQLSIVQNHRTAVPRTASIGARREERSTASHEEARSHAGDQPQSVVDLSARQANERVGRVGHESSRSASPVHASRHSTYAFDERAATECSDAVTRRARNIGRRSNAQDTGQPRHRQAFAENTPSNGRVQQSNGQSAQSKTLERCLFFFKCKYTLSLTERKDTPVKHPLSFFEMVTKPWE